MQALAAEGALEEDHPVRTAPRMARLIGEHRAGDQQEPKHGGDESVGDLPDGFEHIEALANEGHGFEQPRSGGRAHQCRHGGQRRVHQAVSEGSEIGNGIAAVGDNHAVEVDELHETRRHGAATARRGQRGGSTGSGGKQHGLVATGRFGSNSVQERSPVSVVLGFRGQATCSGPGFSFVA